MHRKGVSNGAGMGCGLVPEEIHKGISTLLIWNSVPLARNEMIKNLLQFVPFIIIVCKTWPRGVTLSSCNKMRSLSAVSRLWCYSAGWLTCWNLRLFGWRIPLQAIPDVACAAPQAPKDELSLELFWTCIKLWGFDPMSHGNKKKKNKVIKKAMGGSPICERGTGPLWMAAFQKASRCAQPWAEGLT